MRRAFPKTNAKAQKTSISLTWISHKASEKHILRKPCVPVQHVFRGARRAARIVAAVMMVCSAVAVEGRDYPTKTLRMLTAELGGGSDLSARLIAQGLSVSLGQQVIVDTSRTKAWVLQSPT